MTIGDYQDRRIFAEREDPGAPQMFLYHKRKAEGSIRSLLSKWKCIHHLHEYFHRRP